MTNYFKQPSDLINDEIRDLKGNHHGELRLILWELMKQAKLIELKHEISELKKG